MTTISLQWGIESILSDEEIKEIFAQRLSSDVALAPPLDLSPSRPLCGSDPR